jgi:hypothetical protein
MISVAGQDGTRYFDSDGRKIKKKREIREPSPENDEYNFYFEIDPCM